MPQNYHKYNYEHNYPQNKLIKCKTQSSTYIYNILEEGVYPTLPILQLTAKPNEYKIPTKYKVETTWGRAKNKITVISSINYIEQKPIYKIQWIDKDTYQEKVIQSNKSSSNATLLFSLVSYA
jgi:hypothetical protein